MSVGNELDAYGANAVAIGTSGAVNVRQAIAIGTGNSIWTGTRHIVIGHNVDTMISDCCTIIGTAGHTDAALVYGLNRVTLDTTNAISFNKFGVNESVVNTSATVIAALTITLPDSSVAGQIIRYTTNGNVTAVTMAGGTLATGALTTMTAGQTVEFMASNTSGTWYRIR